MYISTGWNFLKIIKYYTADYIVFYSWFGTCKLDYRAA